MSSAGQQFVAGHIPGEWIGGSIVTTSSANVTTIETVVQSAQVPVVAGRTYEVVWRPKVQTSQATQRTRCRIREDDANGSELQSQAVQSTDSTSVAAAAGAVLVGLFTASITESKTFAGTILRDSGTGNHFLYAVAEAPSLLDVYYRSG